jgi:hypothetical protein
MLVYHKNESDLIYKVTGQHDPGEMGTGDSVCNECGKIMKRCWDTVCSKCDRTFCYDHSYNWTGKWHCKGCFPFRRKKNV